MTPRLNQQWVIKEVDYAKNHIEADNVLKEARLMMKFDHPSIPRIVDIIEKEGLTYIVMDYISGQSLAFELQKKGPQPQEVVILWAKQICNVLMYLHSLTPPIIYHDLKPGNIILKEPEKNIKLVDFGEARPCMNGNAPGGGKTREYAAPEQQEETKGNTDERTDIYCFGTTLYRLLTGSFPPISPEQVGSVRERFPQCNISKGMDNIIRKCTQVRPEQRFQSMAELMEALENIQLWDDDYIKKLKKRVRVVIGTFMCGLLMFVMGIGFERAAAYTNAKDYEKLLSTAKSVDYDTKIANYKEAIAIDGNCPKAYIQLLNAYEEHGSFGEQESRQFSLLYNKYKGTFDPNDQEVLEMHYLIGRIYFNMYSDGSSTIRSRVLKAQEYFQYVRIHGDENYKNYSIAASYHRVCEFFRIFVLNDSSIQEPGKNHYEELLPALRACLKDMKGYQASDAAYIRLTIYGHILEMLNVNLRGFSMNEIERKEVEEVLIQIRNTLKEENVTQQVSLKKQEELLLVVENVLENLNREYESRRRMVLNG